MAVMRINKTTDYTVMSNRHFKEKEMTLKAKGLLSLMLSLPETWDYSINGLCAICKENETAIKSTLKELKKFGYLKITKLYPNETENGRLEYIYDIYEQPQNVQPEEKQAIEKQGVENQPLEIQPVEYPGQLSINELITNQSNTDILNIDNENTENARKRFIPPTIEEVKAYCQERNNNVNAERFVDYYTANGWYVGKRKMKDWRAAVRTWEKNNFSSDNKAGKTYGATGIEIKKPAVDDLAGIL